MKEMAHISMKIGMVQYVFKKFESMEKSRKTVDET